jgi:hypothetical protein
MLVGGRVRRRVQARGTPAAPAPLAGWVHGCRRCCLCRSPGPPHLPAPPSLPPSPRSGCGLLSHCRRRPLWWQWCLPFTPSLSPCPCFDRTTIGRQQLPHRGDDCRLRSLLAGLLDCAHTPLPVVGRCPSRTVATPILCRRPRPSSAPTASSPPALPSLCWWSGSLPRVGDRNTLPSVGGRDPSSALVATTPYPG